MEKPPNILRNFNIAHVKPDQAITDMAQAAFEKIFVLSEKSWSLEAMQHSHDILVLRPEARNFLADLSKWNPH